MKFDEKITAHGMEVVVSRPIKSFNVGEEAKLVRIDIKDPNLVSTNFQEASGRPLKLFQGDGFSVELSKRRPPMPFWHRNMDYDEFIFCFQGSAIWKTELGTVKLKSGEIMVIPRGVSHRVAPDVDSDYIAIEIKSKSITRATE